MTARVLRMGFFLFALFGSLNAEQLKVDSNLMLFPNFDSEVVGRLLAGLEVQVSARTGEWALVETKSAKKVLRGWVLSSNLVSDAAPQESAARLQKKEENFSSNEYRLERDQTSSFYFPTALSRPKGAAAVKGRYFLGWQFDFNVTDNTEIGFHTLVPVGVIGIGPQAKQSFKLTDQVHVAVGATGGALFSLWKKRDSNSFFYYATGAMTTIGDSDYGVTFGGYILGAKLNDYDHVYVGDINAHARISDRWKFMIDGFAPLGFYKSHNESRQAFDWGVITYGLRVSGDTVGGDIGFSVPIYDDAGDVLRYIPLGIPYIALTIKL